MQYLLDTNVFIQAKNSYYGMDFCPAFWDWLDHEQAAGRIVSISGVADELKAQKDELSDWIKIRNNSAFFLPIDDAQTQAAFGSIAEYVVQNYEEKAFNPFLNVAAPWLIAKAMTIPVAFQVATLLAAIAHPSHLVHLSSWGLALLPPRSNLKPFGYIGATLVTHEIPVPSNSKKLKIPNICQQFGVAYINTFTLLRTLKTCFALQAAA